MTKKTKKCKKETPIAAKDRTPCPQGYVWNGTKCIKDVG